MKRELSKINYRIHTDSIKLFVITPELSKKEYEGLCFRGATRCLDQFRKFKR